MLASRPAAWGALPQPKASSGRSWGPQPGVFHHTGLCCTARSRHNQLLAMSVQLCASSQSTSSSVPGSRQRYVVAHASKPNKGEKVSKGKQKQSELKDDSWDEDEDDIIMIDDADEGEYEEDDEEEDGFFDLEGEDDHDGDAADWEWQSGETDVAPGLSTANVPWGETVVTVAKQVLQLPQLAGIELYSLQVHAANQRVDIRLDKLDDVYGSPSIDDIEVFSRKFRAGLEAQLGAEAAADISMEVSSPGAERQLVLPGDLQRFRTLPLRVEYTADDGQATSAILQMVEMDEASGSIAWALADVRANAPTKGRGLTKKQKQQRFNIPVASLKRVRIFVDF